MALCSRWHDVNGRPVPNLKSSGVLAIGGTIYWAVSRFLQFGKDYAGVNTTACKRLFSLGCVPHTDGAVFQRLAPASPPRQGQPNA